jgi:1-phosphatidylinositol phosphodiesterase
MSSHGTSLRLENQTKNSFTTTVSGVDSYDWDGDSRPDHNFNTVTIASAMSEKRSEELNGKAKSAWFTMRLDMSNGAWVEFRNDQYDAHNGIPSSPRTYTLDGPYASQYLLTQSVNKKAASNSFVLQDSRDFSKIDPKTWMSKIAGATCLADIAIPGSHDTASRSWTMAKCQDLSTTDQLNAGVRFLDIRGAVKDYEIRLAHGITIQGGNITGIFQECENFLKQHPSETIIMSIKNEAYDEKIFENIVTTDIKKFGSLFIVDDAIPILQQARGHVVLARRFSSETSSYGLNFYNGWEDNIIFSFHYQATTKIEQYVQVQDCYTTKSLTQKETFIDDGLEKAKTAGAGEMILNFCSCTGDSTFPNPGDAAQVINDYVYKKLLPIPKGQKLGIILFDFVHETMAKEVISKNLFAL